jgi:MSHA biogenesis protein MshQ
MTNARWMRSWLGAGLAALLVLFFPAIVEAQWYDNAYLHRKQITIAGTRVMAPLTDFPVLIRITSDSDLAADAQDSGNDILFTSSDMVTKLSHEIESFDGATGALIAWVKVPALASPANTILYMYYRNGTATNQQTPLTTWDANFRAVYHLGGIPTVSDSTSNVNHGTAVGASGLPTSVAGAAGNCLSFDGVDDGVTVPNSASLQITGAITMEAWVNLNVDRASIADFAYMVSKRTNSGAEEYVLRFGPPTMPAYDNLYFATQNAGISDYMYYPPAPETPAPIIGQTWSYIVGTWIPLTGAQPVPPTMLKTLYINGSRVMQRGSSNAVIGTSTAPLEFARSGLGSYLNAKMDEVRVSSVARSEAHVTTSFNTMVYPDFFALGGEEGVGTTTGAATTGAATTGAATTGGVPPPAGGGSGDDSACSCGSICPTGLGTTMVGLLLAGLALLLVVRRAR